MKYSDKARKQLTEVCEGLRLRAYQDSVGAWTIGFGHTGKEVHDGLIITAAQADQDLVNDVTWAEAAVNRLVKVPLTQHQFDALVDFTFNLGAGAFQNSTLLKLINSKQYDIAAKEFGKWNKAGGKVLDGLTVRRALEQQWFNTPD